MSKPAGRIKVGLVGAFLGWYLADWIVQIVHPFIGLILLIAINPEEQWVANALYHTPLSLLGLVAGIVGLAVGYRKGIKSYDRYDYTIHIRKVGRVT